MHHRHRVLAAAAALTVAITVESAAQEGFQFGACPDPAVAKHRTGPIRSLYLTMRDGVKIAVDLTLPDGGPPASRFPTVVQITRYWRGGQNDQPTEAQRFFTDHGYATVWVDVRGTGASSGVWRRSRSGEETRDYAEVVDWIRKQPWSNGEIAGWGTSYSANAADFLAAEAGRRVKAILPLFPDFDLYSDLIAPGGIFLQGFGKAWSERVKAQDLNEPRPGPDGQVRGVRRVDADSTGTVLAAHLAERDTIPGIFEGYRRITFKDDNPPNWDGSLNQRSTHAQINRLEGSGTPMFTWASWMDAGTANGALHRFGTLSNDQRVIIGAWSHGARFSASPFQPADAPLAPTVEEQRREQLCFLDRYLRKAKNGWDARQVFYYTMGEERWKSTAVWPPAGFVRRRYFLDDGRVLADKAPDTQIGSDQYRVDFEASTGTTNRWHTQLTGADVVYPDRAAADRRLLVYTSAPLQRDVEVTGTPWVNLAVRSTHADGAFFVYLEDVAPDGRVTYVSEGQLRGLHRRTSSYPAPYRMFEPYHSFQRRDAQRLDPGRLAQLEFGLLPTSVLFRKNHRIRIAIAGADKDSFVRIPETGDPVITIERSRDNVSWVSLPMKER